MHRTVVAIFQALEVAPHFTGIPTRVAGEPRDVVPIFVVRINQNHRIVRRASAQGAGTRIQHAIYRFAVQRLVILWIAFLNTPVGKMTYEEIPLHGVIFRSKGVEGGNVVVLWQAIDAGSEGVAARQFARVAAGFKQDYLPAGFRKSRGYRAAARA